MRVATRASTSHVRRIRGHLAGSGWRPTIEALREGQGRRERRDVQEARASGMRITGPGALCARHGIPRRRRVSTRSRSFRPAPEATADARRFVRASLKDQPRVLVDDAVLLPTSRSRTPCGTRPRRTRSTCPSRSSTRTFASRCRMPDAASTLGSSLDARPCRRSGREDGGSSSSRHSHRDGAWRPTPAARWCGSRSTDRRRRRERATARSRRRRPGASRPRRGPTPRSGTRPPPPPA